MEVLATKMLTIFSRIFPENRCAFHECSRGLLGPSKLKSFTPDASLTLLDPLPMCTLAFTARGTLHQFRRSRGGWLYVLAAGPRICAVLARQTRSRHRVLRRT